MYDNAETKAVEYGNARMASAQYAVQSGVMAGNAIGGLNQAPKPVIAQAMLQELQSLLEKARMVENRQINLHDRIFGPAPQCETAGQKDSPNNGFLHEANNKIQSLHSTLDRIIQNCVSLERLA